MNTFLRHLIFLYLYLVYFFYMIFKAGPFGKNKPVFIDDSFNVSKKLLENQVKQFNEASCSVASVAVIINSLRDNNFDPVTQKELLEKVDACAWKKRMSLKGDNGKRGLPLDMLGHVVEKAFEVYKIPYKKIQTIDFSGSSDEADLKNDLRKRLDELDKEKAFIIAHFNQGLLIPTLQIPHISPIGGYDAKNDEVIVLDVDFSVEKNYKVSLNSLFKAMKSNYYNLFISHGYGMGGYVYIKI